MSQSKIQQFSSRSHRLDKTVLTKYLQQARRYHRIAGYFTSSLFEIAGEHLDGIGDVRIVCNAVVQSDFRRVIHEIRGELSMKSQDFDTAAPVVDLPHRAQPPETGHPHQR